MIEPDTEVPTKHHDVLQTVHDGQRQMVIQVYESTTDMLTENVEDHIRLVDGDLVGLPAGLPRGYAVELDFELGMDGILRIRARAANGATLQLDARISGEIPPQDMDASLPGKIR